MRIKAVIFDLDGTLLDTERLFSDCMIEAAEEESWKLDQDTVFDCIGTTEAETERIIINAMGPGFPYKLIRRKGVERFRNFIDQNGIPFKNGVHRLMDCLDLRKIPFGIATTTVRQEVEELLNFAGIKERFATIVCGDDVKMGKPHPEIYYKAAENLGVQPQEILVFEDSTHGIMSATSAGTRVVWIPDIQEIPEAARERCFEEIGSLDAVCDRLGELVE